MTLRLMIIEKAYELTFCTCMCLLFVKAFGVKVQSVMPNKYVKDALKTLNGKYDAPFDESFRQNPKKCEL